jgi:hypothetical protein
MIGKTTEQIEPTPKTAHDDWIAAQTALEVAQKLPADAERFEALKRAGLLRNKAADRLEAEGRDRRRPSDK